MPYLAMLRSYSRTELLSANDSPSHFQHSGCLTLLFLSCPCTHQDFSLSDRVSMISSRAYTLVHR